METVDYKALYELQDSILQIVFEKPSCFYLTGGTALHRFIYQERHSDDLDFFANSSKTFLFEYKAIEKKLKKNYDVKTVIDGYGFKRLLIKEKNINLKLDFINDLEFYFGQPQVIRGFVIDNVDNILINKITALIGRDEAKDVFDLLTIFKYHDFEWETVIQAAWQKAYFLLEELVLKLKNFPISLLETLTVIHPISREEQEKNLQEMMEEILILKKHTRKK